MCSFKHYPENKVCPICGTNDDKECILIPIAHTQSGNNVEAQPFHLDCMSEWRNCWYDPEYSLIYRRLSNGQD